MTKDVLLSLVRTLLTGFGAFLIGKHFLGQTIDTNNWSETIGILITGVSVIWGIVDKSATMEMVQSGIRSIVIFFGGLFVAKGSITGDQLTSIIGLSQAAIAFIYSTISKAKTAKIVSTPAFLAKLKSAA